MTASHPLRRLLARPFLRHRHRHRPLSTSAVLPHRAPNQPARDNPPTPSYYTHADLESLRKKYSPSQVASFLAGEATISHTDFETRIPRPRNDEMRLPYLDDLSTYDPILDFPNPAAPPPYVPGYPLQPLPLFEDSNSNDLADDTRPPWMRDVARKIGFSSEQVSRLRHRILVSHRVVNMTHMGKIGRIYSLAVAGNGNGLVGIGEGKATEYEDSHRMATYMAVRNLEPIPRYEGRTIYGDVKVKVGAVELGLYSRPPGFGVRCSQYVFEIARCLGIQDLSARATRSRNPMNVIKATMHALRSQKLPETIARGRGKKFVDVRKVYYNGMV